MTLQESYICTSCEGSTCRDPRARLLQDCLQERFEVFNDHSDLREVGETWKTKLEPDKGAKNPMKPANPTKKKLFIAQRIT